jgi:hypothetical protein
MVGTSPTMTMTEGGYEKTRSENSLRALEEPTAMS